MKKHPALHILPIAIISAFAFLPCHAQTPNSTVAKPLISVDSVNLSAKLFLQEFISPSIENRHHARLYMLGVMDATEGKTWCSYAALKTTTLNEFVFEKMKKMSPAQLSRRAAVAIEEALTGAFPCKAQN